MWTSQHLASPLALTVAKPWYKTFPLILAYWGGSWDNRMSYPKNLLQLSVMAYTYNPSYLGYWGMKVPWVQELKASLDNVARLHLFFHFSLSLSLLVLGFELRASHICYAGVHHLSHTSSPRPHFFKKQKLLLFNNLSGCPCCQRRRREGEGMESEGKKKPQQLKLGEEKLQLSSHLSVPRLIWPEGILVPV
jgi:hypothetical protein